MSVLILRTIDLLRLLKLHLNRQTTLPEVKNLLTQNSGWLRVNDTGWTIASGEDVPETDGNSV
jgi:hypothetical protein